jgi:hypothetical protein
VYPESRQSVPVGSISRKKTDLNDQERVISMTEKPRHVEQGVLGEERAHSAPQANGDAIDRRLSEATKAVISSIDNVMSLTHDLVATEEGKQYIETTLKDTQKQIQLSFNAIISRVKAELDKTKKDLDKKVAELDKKIFEPGKIKAEPVKPRTKPAKAKAPPGKTKAEPARTKAQTKAKPE